jgi:hypothetical protein
MEKRPVEMTGEELNEAVELAEIIMYLATDVAQTESEQVAIVSAQMARIRLLRQHIKARMREHLLPNEKPH